MMPSSGISHLFLSHSKPETHLALIRIRSIVDLQAANNRYLAEHDEPIHIDANKPGRRRGARRSRNRRCPMLDDVKNLRENDS
jgi:hypothetical protein